MECRFCLNKTPKKCIFSLPYKFIQTIMKLLKVEKDDGLPELICKGCVTKIKNIENFIQKCEDTNNVLRNKVVANIKNEPETTSTLIETPKKEPDILENISHIKQDVESDIKVLKTDLVEKDCGDMKSEDDCDFMNLTISQCESDDLAEQDRKDISKKKVKKKVTETKMKRKYKKRDRKNKTTLSKEEKKIESKERKECRLRKKCPRNYAEGRLCPHCGMCFTNRVGYSIHLKRHSEIIYECDYCSRKFHYKESLKRHVKSHMQKERYSCRFCHKQFKCKNYVSKHEEVVHIKTKPDFNCNVCGKGFFAKDYLKVHMLVHSGVRTEQCHICSKTFLRNGGLRKHLVYHSDKRPYVCRYCPNAFKNGEHRKKHERLHTGETPHKCPVCLKGFAQKCNMRSHFVHNHKELDFIKTMAEFQKSQEAQKTAVK